MQRFWDVDPQLQELTLQQWARAANDIRDSSMRCQKLMIRCSQHL
jgi:hypothetical protein